jgi:hypothetical protein
MTVRSLCAATLLPAFFLPCSADAEIFDLVNNYEITGVARYIKSADFNNDGLDDFVVTSDSTFVGGGWGGYEVFLSNGDFSFMPMGVIPLDTTGAEIFRWGIMTGDFIEDGNEDLLIVNRSNSTKLYSGNGTGVFSLVSTYTWTVYGHVADIDNDGHLDLAGVNQSSVANEDSVIAMLGDGSGGFIQSWAFDDATTYPNSYNSCQGGYFGGLTDTIIDLCVPCDMGFLVFQGNGDGTFTEPDYYTAQPLGDASQYCSACGDFDEDGFTDIAVTGQAGMSEYSTFIFLNQGDGTFEQSEPGFGYFIGSSGSSIATADLDLDSHLDLSVGSGGGGSIAGNGDGSFGLVLSDKPWTPFVLIDVDLDGDLDLILKYGQVFTNTTISLGCEEEESISQPVLSISPNPFSSSLSISYNLPEPAQIELSVYDLTGRLVEDLVSSSISAGENTSVWNPDPILPVGCYVIVLDAFGDRAVRRCVKLN